MKITKAWLKENDACSKGIAWFEVQKEIEVVKVAKALIKENKLSWANWLLPRTMKYKQYVEYAIYSAELVLPIFEKKYPENKKPSIAIEAAKKCLENPSKKNKKAAAKAAETPAA